MRNYIMAAIAAACLFGAVAPAQAQYYYRDNYYRSTPSWSPWDNRVNSRHVNCNALNNVSSFERMDRNNDGQVSRWEFRRMGIGLSHFYQLDLNGNGVVSRYEMRTVRRSCY